MQYHKKQQQTEQDDRLNKVMVLASLDGGILGAVFTAAFLLTSELLTSIFLREQALIAQSALFLRILCLSAPALGVINMVTAYYQALGKAANSLLITLLRNVILFVPAVMLLSRFAGLNGAIAAQPLVETVLAVVCVVMYLTSRHAAVRRDGVSDGIVSQASAVIAM